MLLMHLHQFDISETRIQEKSFLELIGHRNLWKDMETEGQKYVRIITASISVTISESFKLAPTLFKPLFSSSNVICPLLSVSSILNISLNPAISSSDKFSAMTCRHPVQREYQYWTQ